jgi:hypothetical protein
MKENKRKINSQAAGWHVSLKLNRITLSCDAATVTRSVVDGLAFITRWPDIDPLTITSYNCPVQLIATDFHPY